MTNQWKFSEVIMTFIFVNTELKVCFFFLLQKWGNPSNWLSVFKMGPAGPIRKFFQIKKTRGLYGVTFWGPSIFLHFIKKSTNTPGKIIESSKNKKKKKEKKTNQK